MRICRYLHNNWHSWIMKKRYWLKSLWKYFWKLLWKKVKDNWKKESDIKTDSEIDADKKMKKKNRAKVVGDNSKDIVNTDTSEEK